MQINGNFCGLVLNQPLGGLHVIEGLPLLADSTDGMASVAAYTYRRHSVVFIGTRSGSLKKVAPRALGVWGWGQSQIWDKAGGGNTQETPEDRTREDMAGAGREISLAGSQEPGPAPRVVPQPPTLTIASSHCGLNCQLPVARGTENRPIVGSPCHESRAGAEPSLLGSLLNEQESKCPAP